jgi:hypothetical protein
MAVYNYIYRLDKTLNMATSIIQPVIMVAQWWLEQEEESTALTSIIP